MRLIRLFCYMLCAVLAVSPVLFLTGCDDKNDGGGTSEPDAMFARFMVNGVVRTLRPGMTLYKGSADVTVQFINGGIRVLGQDREDGVVIIDDNNIQFAPGDNVVVHAGVASALTLRTSGMADLTFVSQPLPAGRTLGQLGLSLAGSSVTKVDGETLDNVTAGAMVRVMTFEVIGGWGENSGDVTVAAGAVQTGVSSFFAPAVTGTYNVKVVKGGQTINLTLKVGTITGTFSGVSIDPEPDSGLPTQVVLFKGVVTGLPGGVTVTSRSWTSSDGGSASTENYSHAFSTTGTFTVSLTVNTSDGKVGTATVNYVVHAVTGGGDASFVIQPTHEGAWWKVTVGVTKAGQLKVDLVNAAGAVIIDGCYMGSTTANATYLASAHQSFAVSGTKFRYTFTPTGGAPQTDVSTAIP